MADTTVPNTAEPQRVVYNYVPEPFVAALRAAPDDFTVRLVMADYLDEFGRSDEAAAWRWSAEKRLAPIYLTPELYGVGGTKRPTHLVDVFFEKWNWLSRGWVDDRDLARAAVECSDRSMPQYHVSDDPVLILDSLIEFYLISAEYPPRRHALDTMTVKL